MMSLQLLALLGCGPAMLPADAEARLLLAAQEPDALGERIYEGRVARRDGEGLELFRYERRILDLEEGLFASHLTRSVSGEPVVLHQALQSWDHQLLSFEEIHAQTGLVGQLWVASDGTASFESTQDGRTKTRQERPGEPLHVGPTLFGYVQVNWASLLDGASHRVRFAVLEDLRSYDFDLVLVDAQPEETTFEMRASNPVVALGVPTMRLVFDSDQEILRYSGLVPPLEELDGRLEKLDATVTYTFAGAR
jgi:hypothetical protein